MVTLVIQHAATGEQRRLAGGRLVIGRAVGADWVIPDAGSETSLSRRHCLIESGPQGCRITDLDSTNGTRINGRPLAPQTPAPVASGDILELGRHRLVVTAEAERGPSGELPRPSAGPSLEDVLAELGGGPVPVAPVVVPAGATPKALDQDPLGEWREEILYSPPPPMAPRRDVGESRGDHVAPQHSVFELSPSPSPPPSPPAVPPDRLLAAFLDGAGLARTSLGARDPESVMREAGQALAAMADGLRELLVTRSLVRSHASVERTVIGARDNNPLKFARTPGMAVRAVLGEPEPGDLPGLAAIEAGVRDLVAHEMAVLEGVKGALAALLAQFDPPTLEASLGAASTLDRLLPAMRKAKLWELYEDRYQEIAEAARRRFMGDLDDAFRAAYERKLAEIKGDGRRSGRDS